MSYEYMNPDFSEVFSAFMPIIIFYLWIFVFALFLGIASYVLRGIALYKMSENRNIPNGWLGFIPYARNYQFGKVAGEIELGGKKIKNTGVWLLVLPIAAGCICFIGYIIAMVPFFFKIFSLGEYAAPEAIMRATATLFTSIIVLALVMLVINVILCLFRYLALHKIYSLYSIGQKPVFYLLMSMFVPLAEPVLLLMNSNRPTLESKAALDMTESSELTD